MVRFTAKLVVLLLVACCVFAETENDLQKICTEANERLILEKFDESGERVIYFSVESNTSPLLTQYNLTAPNNSDYFLFFQLS